MKGIYMRVLYAPWRNVYAAKVNTGKTDFATAQVCDFCTQLTKETDDQFFILRRFRHSFVCLNLYPYNAGHILILPFAHVACPADLSLEARAEIMELISYSTSIAQDTLKCDGINVGINLGKAAGAGIPSHLHVHILPRWTGDTNFLPTLADTKTVSFDLAKIYEQLKPAYAELKLY